jgi:hypothetical protein
MQTSEHQYSYQILLWLLKLIVKDWLFKLQQNSVTLATLQKHLDDHKKGGNEQFFYSNKSAVWTVPVQSLKNAV